MNTTTITISTASTSVSWAWGDDDEPPASGVREPRRPILPVTSGSVALERAGYVGPDEIAA